MPVTYPLQLAPEGNLMHGGSMDGPTFGARIARLRKRRGWSQRQLAQRAGVSNVTISDIEMGRTSRPRIDVLQKVAAALDATLDDLLGGHSSGSSGEGEAPQPQSVESLIREIAMESVDEGMDARETEEFLTMWWRLPPEVRRLMRLQAETYTKLAEEHRSDNKSEGKAAGGDR